MSKKKTASQWPDGIEPATGPHSVARIINVDRAASRQLAFATLIADVCAVYGVTEASLLNPHTRNRGLCDMRRTAMALTEARMPTETGLTKAALWHMALGSWRDNLARHRDLLHVKDRTYTAAWNRVKHLAGGIA